MGTRPMLMEPLLGDGGLSLEEYQEPEVRLLERSIGNLWLELIEGVGVWGVGNSSLKKMSYRSLSEGAEGESGNHKAADE